MAEFDGGKQDLEYMAQGEPAASDNPGGTNSGLSILFVSLCVKVGLCVWLMHRIVNNVSLCWSVTVWFFNFFFVLVCLLFGHMKGGGAGMSNIKPMWATYIRSHKWTACSWMGIWPLIFVFEVWLVSVWWPFVTCNLWKEKNGHKKWMCAGEENSVEGWVQVR